MIKAIIFDAEGVVIDTHPIWVEGDLEFIKNKTGLKDPSQIYHSKIVQKITGKSIKDGAKIMQEILNFPGQPEDFEIERMEIMERLLKNNIKFVSGFEDFFNSCVKNIYKTAIGTSIKKEFMKLTEDQLPIREYFGKNIFHIYDVGGISKPEPDIFLFAAQQLNVFPNECVVIEDAPNGIEAASRAGMMSIGITTSFPREALKKANQVINNFYEINLNEF